MKITDTIKYVGVNDHQVDLFEGQYKVPNGMAYNSYVILDEKIAVMDTVDAGFTKEWLDNIEELGWQLYLCSSPPYLLQTTNDRRMDEYTELAFAGKFDQARRVRDSLNRVRDAIRSTKPGGKPTAHGKYWQELLGQVGGRVRHPMLELTQAEKDATKAAFEASGLKL